MDNPAVGKILKALDVADKVLDRSHAGKAMGQSIPCCPNHATIGEAREALGELVRTPPPVSQVPAGRECWVRFNPSGTMDAYDGPVKGAVRMVEPSPVTGEAGDLDFNALADEMMSEIPNNDLEDHFPKLAESIRQWAHSLRYARLRSLQGPQGDGEVERG